MEMASELLTISKFNIVNTSQTCFNLGQAYVALSCVQKLDDMILWDFCASAIHLLQFYRLKWYDVVRPTPSIDVIPFPNRCDDISNAPFQNNADNLDMST